MPKHQAAVVEKVGQPLSVIERDTPDVGPNEVLIETKAMAMNPVDWYGRDMGIPPIPIFPAVLGEDIAGIVVKVGSDVKNVPPPGSRVLAFASSYYEDGKADYGAFQKMVIARSNGVIALPEKYSFAEGAILPLAVLTALSAYTTLGMSLETTKFTPADKEAILIWGASSSVGSLAVQTAKALGFIVYATAGAKNIDYVKKLGASQAWDYKSSSVITDIAEQAKKDGVKLRTAHVIVDNSLQQTLDVIKLTKGDLPAKVAHAPLLKEGHPTLDNTEIKFTYTPIDPAERDKHIEYCYHTWLQNALANGSVVPSPHIKIIPGGVAGVNDALDALKAGVSCTKVIVTPE